MVFVQLSTGGDVMGTCSQPLLRIDILYNQSMNNYLSMSIVGKFEESKR